MVFNAYLIFRSAQTCCDRSNPIAVKFCMRPRGKRNGKALSGADFGLRSSQSVNSHKTNEAMRCRVIDIFLFFAYW